MNKIVASTIVIGLAGAFSLGPAMAADLQPQAVPMVKVNVEAVTNGYRASKIIGSSVVNDNGDTVGSVDDIITGQDRRSSFAVISVGGFLGVGNKLVVVPFDTLKVSDGKITMPGATKNALKDLPSFNYNKGWILRPAP